MAHKDIECKHEKSQHRPDMKYQEIPIGGIIEEAGNSICYPTGDWRTFIPVHIPEKCTDCVICWFNCPDSSIVPRDGDFDRFLYTHCKGCGICEAVCPTKAIKLLTEKEFKEQLPEKTKCYSCGKEINVKEFKDDQMFVIYVTEGENLALKFFCCRECYDKKHAEIREARRAGK